MRVLVIGATGTVGRAVVAALGGRHDVIAASDQGATEHVDLSDPASIRELFRRIRPVDAVVSTAGQRGILPVCSSVASSKNSSSAPTSRSASSPTRTSSSDCASSSWAKSTSYGTALTLSATVAPSR